MLETMSPGAVRLRLSEILKDRGMKQADLARKSNLSEIAISRLAGNARQIRLNTLARLCDALNVTPGELLEYNPDPEEIKESI